MGYDIHTLIISAIITSVLGGGIGAAIVRLFMRNEAKEALKDDLDKIDNDIKNIEQNYVTCAVCAATHNSLSSTLKDIGHKLDLLIENALKK